MSTLRINRALVTRSSISHGYYLARDCYRSFAGTRGKFGEGWLFWRALISFLKWPARRSTICLSGEMEIDDILLSFSFVI